MGHKKDIYNHDKHIERELVLLENADISKKNKQIILKFKRQIAAEGLSKPRVLFYMHNLRFLAGWLKKDFDKARKTDLMDLVEKIEGMDYADWTKYDFKVTIKRFYKWLKKSEDYPPLVKWIKTSMKNKGKMLPEELLTEAEVKKMITKAEYPRDKALIAILYDSGCRIGEILTMTIKNIKFDEYSAVITVDGKTGMRRVRCITSTPYLSSYLEYHPFKDKPGAPMWIGLSNSNKNRALDYPSVRKVIRTISKKAGIQKKVNPHMFRHSRATDLASKLTEAQMNEFFGWIQGSNMPATYVHMSGRNVDKTLLKIYGMEIEEEQNESLLKPRDCYRCGTTNPSTGKFCSTCGNILDEKTAMEFDKESQKTDDMLAQLLEDEEIQGVMIKRMKEMGVGSASSSPPPSKKKKK